VPLALGWGADPSFRSPMAITVIGGLITSTLLSLLVVPAVFTYIDDLDAPAQARHGKTGAARRPRCGVMTGWRWKNKRRPCLQNRPLRARKRRTGRQAALPRFHLSGILRPFSMNGNLPCL